MNAWVQWFMPDDKPVGQPEAQTNGTMVEPPGAARSSAAPIPPPSPVFRQAGLKPPEPPIRAELLLAFRAIVRQLTGRQ